MFSPRIFAIILEMMEASYNMNAEPTRGVRHYCSECHDDTNSEPDELNDDTEPIYDFEYIDAEFKEN